MGRFNLQVEMYLSFFILILLLYIEGECLQIIIISGMSEITSNDYHVIKRDRGYEKS